MIRSFATRGTRDIFEGLDTIARRACPESIWTVARRKLDQLNQATDLSDLRAPPGNRLEKLRGDRRGQHSVRINDQFRVCFRWSREGPGAVEIVDYHR